jgi:hypothetical protein
LKSITSPKAAAAVENQLNDLFEIEFIDETYKDKNHDIGSVVTNMRTGKFVDGSGRGSQKTSTLDG